MKQAASVLTPSRMVLPGPGKAHAQLCRLGYPSVPRVNEGRLDQSLSEAEYAEPIRRGEEDADVQP